jgi:uncharacterized protein YprB with RNaseH-like and TPR domain
MDLRERLRALETRLGVGTASPNTTQGQSTQGQPQSGSAGASLAARLQRLIPSSATEATSRRRTVDLAALARDVRGEACADGVIAIECTLPLTQRHGRVPFSRICDASLAFLAGGVEPDRDRLLFLDTETTGLAGGTGTVAFVLGLARIRDQSVQVRQYLLTRFAGEPAMLAHALEWIGPDSQLVTFNGKSFDAPLLTTRYLLALRRDPLAALAHIDLLHRTRAAFARRWDDCRLQTAEQHLLKLFRTDDVPGHLIPQIWAAWLQRGDSTGLRGVAEHNRLDVLSLVALAAVLGQAYAEPGGDDADPLGIARAHRRAGDAHLARRHLEESAMPLGDEACLELADLHARAEQWQSALPLWEQLARRDCLVAMERLAIYHEHRQRDYDAALSWTERMLQTAGASQAIEHRRARLMRRRRRLT